MFRLQEFLLVTAAATALLASSLAQAAGVRVRGEITTLADTTATVTNAADQRTEVLLAKDYVVLVYRNIDLDDIPDNAYVGIPSVTNPDGTRRALGLVVFPETMRGLNEGFFEWDLTAGSKMTNGTLAQVVARAGERVLEISFGEEKQTVFIPEYAQVSTFSAEADRKLAVGDKVVIFADDTGASLTGKYIGVHANGGLPPL